MVYEFRRLKEGDGEDGEPNSLNLTQQPEQVHVAKEPMKEALEYMNDNVKNVQEEIVEIDLNDGEEGERLVKISRSLFEEERRKLITLLREYKDVFAWSYQEIPVLSPNLVTHNLKVDPDAKPVKHPPWKYRLDVEEKIKVEIKKIKNKKKNNKKKAFKGGFIEEIECLSWLVNIVPIKKKDSQITICGFSGSQ